MAGRTHEVPLPLERPRPLQPGRPLPEQPSELRQWAKEHGFDVASKGRIPVDVEAAYCQEPLTGLRLS